MFRCLGQGPSVKESMARGGPLGVAPPFAVVESGDGDGPAEVNLLLLQNFENSRDDVDFVGEKQGIKLSFESQRRGVEHTHDLLFDREKKN